jgi:hypothetical protein
MLMGFFYVCKMVEIHYGKKSIKLKILIFKFQKIRVRFIMISKTKLKSFQINLILELFIHLMLELLELLLNFYSLGITIFL